MFLIFLYSFQALALDFQSARTLSLGGGGRSGALLNDSVTLNPSILGFIKAQGISGTYFWFNPKNTTSTFNASVIDGKNEYFSAGVSFTRSKSLDFIHLSASKLLLPWLSAGLHAKRFATLSNRTAVSGQGTTAYDGGASITAVTNFLPLPIQAALTSDNLFSNERKEALVGPREYSLGLKTNLNDILLLYFDATHFSTLNRDKYRTYAPALELAIGGGLFVRGALTRGKNTGWGAGGGYVGPKVGLHYGFQKKSFPVAENQAAVSLDIFI